MLGHGAVSHSEHGLLVSREDGVFGGRIAARATCCILRPFISQRPSAQPSLLL